jgi:thiol:disulfide interchange protein DsbC
MLRVAIAALFGALSLTACAQQPSAPAASKGASPAAAATAAPAAGSADERVRSAQQKLDPKFAPDYIGAAPFPGFREVLVGGQVLYVTDDGRYLMQSQPYDIQNKAPVSSAGLLAYRQKLLAKVPQAERIVFAAPNAKYTVSVFTDIAFPRMGLGSQDYTDMISVWCAADRKQALTAAKTGKPVAPKNCTNPVAMQYTLGQQMGVNGTPAIFAADGTQLGGYVPPAQLKAALERTTAGGSR